MEILKLKSIPKFNNEDEERAFWDKSDSMEYIDWSKAKVVSPTNNEKNELFTVSLNKSVLTKLEKIAKKQGLSTEKFIESYLRKLSLTG